MRFNFLLLFTLFILISCKQNNSIPDNSIIIAKYIVLNENLSNKVLKDIENIENLNPDNEFQVAFKLAESKYFIEYKFFINNDGSLLKINDLTHNDSLYLEHNLEKENIDFEKIGIGYKVKSYNNKYIIDRLDTLKIKKVFPSEKLIFVIDSNRNERKYIYHYK